MDLATKTKTQLHAWGDDEALFDSKGIPLPSEEADQYNQLLWDNGLIADAFGYSNENHDTIDPQTSLFDFFTERINKMFLDEPTSEAKRKRENFLQLVWLWSCYIGSPITRQSLKFFWLEECIEGENPFVAGTYAKILDAVSKAAKDQATIHYETEVTAIDLGGLATTAERPTLPKISTDVGISHEFDEVVVTTPLGWLKENKAAFQPELPPRLSAAIDNISYGHLDKVYVTFPSAFWETGSLQDCHAVSHSSDPEGTTTNVTAITTPLHQPQSDKDSKHFAGFTHFLSPAYAQSTNPHQWNQECMNLAALGDESAHPTLLFYIQGPQSKHIADLVYDTVDEKERDAKLLEFFEPYYSRLPNYDPTRSDCIPSAVLATAWARDKFAGYGSYSNFQIGLEKGDEDIEVMRHGMPERGVWLAGEHTSPFVALGTSTGAYWSGQKVAERILNAYQMHN